MMKSRVLFEAKKVTYNALVLYRDSYSTCHTINTISSSYLAFLALWNPDCCLSLKSCKEAALLQSVGSGTERSRPGKITLKFQWHNSQNQSSSSSCPKRRWWREKRGGEREGEREEERKTGSKEEGVCLQRNRIPVSSVSQSDENIELLSGNLLTVWGHMMRRFKDLGP